MNTMVLSYSGHLDSGDKRAAEGTVVLSSLSVHVQYSQLIDSVLSDSCTKFEE